MEGVDIAQFSDIYNRVLRYSDTSDSVTAKALVNDIYRDIVRETEIKAAKVSKSLTAGTVFYTISVTFAISDLLSIKYIEYSASGSTDSYPVVPTSLEEILALRNQSTPSGVVRLYAMRDYDTLELYPAPQTTGDTLDIYYVQAPTALSADSDLPSAIPSEFHDTITFGATARMCEDEDADLAETYEQKYQRRLNLLRWYVRERVGNIPRRTRVGYPTRRTQMPHDRSSYYSGDSR